MAYNLRNVIDVANKLQNMPPDRKTFGYGLALIKGTAPEGSDLVMGPYTSVEEVAEATGSNSEAVRIATTYFQNGWYGKPYQLFVAYANTETLNSLPLWTAGQSYTVGYKVNADGAAYVCTLAHASSGEFNTNLWTESEEPLDNAEDWTPETVYEVGQEVKINVSEDPEVENFEYYTCNYAHESGETFQLSCWESFTPTGKDISAWMVDFLQDSKNYYVFLPSTEFSTQELVSIAGSVEASTQPKLCIETYSNSDAYSTTELSDLGAQLKALKYNRTMVVYEPLNEAGVVQYVGAAVLAGYATVSFTSARPSITMANKLLTGVNALDLNSSTYSALQGKNYNFYTKTTDIDTDMFIDTRMSSGQFFDTIQAADWLAYDMKYKLVSLVQNRDKIPFTADGLAMVKQTLSETCVEALNSGIIGSGYDQDNNFIENGFLITMPELSDISKSDKAHRILRDVKVTFLLAGAIQVINILNDIQL